MVVCARRQRETRYCLWQRQNCSKRLSHGQLLCRRRVWTGR